MYQSLGWESLRFNAVQILKFHYGKKSKHTLSLEQGPSELAVIVVFQKAQACQQRLSKEVSDFLAMVKSLDATKGKAYSFKM